MLIFSFFFDLAINIITTLDGNVDLKRERETKRERNAIASVKCTKSTKQPSAARKEFFEIEKIDKVVGKNFFQKKCFYC